MELLLDVSLAFEVCIDYTMWLFATTQYMIDFGSAPFALKEKTSTHACACLRVYSTLPPDINTKKRELRKTLTGIYSLW